MEFVGYLSSGDSSLHLMYHRVKIIGFAAMRHRLSPQLNSSGDKTVMSSVLREREKREREVMSS